MDTYFIIFSFIVFFIEENVVGIDGQMNEQMNKFID